MNLRDRDEGKRNRRRGAAGVSAVFGVVLVALAITCAVMSVRWIGATFPGFFVMPNRVIPAAGLSSWTGVEAGDIFHYAVVEVDGHRVRGGEDVYALVAAKPAGTPIKYVLAAGGEPSRRVIHSMTFGLGDYAWIFGVYLMTGFVFAGVGIIVWWLKPRTAESWAMLALGCSVGTYAITATSLYGPYWFYRLHLSAEAMLPATLAHLALVFPKNNIARKQWVLAFPYGLGLCLALAHQWFHFAPAAYSLIYGLCSAYLGVAAIGLILSVAYAYRTTTSQLVRQRVRVLLVGTVTAAGPAAVIMGASGLSGGSVPVNAVAFTTFAFPLTLAYGIVKHDLFAIDAMVKRAMYYLVLSAAVFVVYALAISFLDLLVPRGQGIAGSIAYALALSLAVVLLFDPLKARARRFVDRVCFRRGYEPETVLQATSQAFASTLHLGDVLEVLLSTVSGEMQVSRVCVYLGDDAGELSLAGHRSSDGWVPPARIQHEDPVVRSVARHHRAVSVYDLVAPETRDEGLATPDLFRRLGADLLLALRFRDEFVGMVALGPKMSGAFYTAADVEFLGTLAAQSVVSILHSMDYQRIERLNVDLERKVSERTEQLASANDELRESLTQRERAYGELQRKQEQLVHAEKMAAFGRLTAGIAHEISTPLGAALSTIQIAQDVVREYRDLIDEPSTSAEDHHGIATELSELSAEVRAWTEKAARFVRSIKLYALGREDLSEREFSLSEVIEETCQLMAHKVRLCGCTLEVSVAGDMPLLFGDPGRLGQVITNLATNAVDAYREMEPRGGPVRIRAAHGGADVIVQISDDGSGIPADALDHIFEELFTTKPPGLGTGLGLPISRSIVRDCFDGAIDVESEVGRGTTFTVTIPRQRQRVIAAGDEASDRPASSA